MRRLLVGWALIAVATVLVAVDAPSARLENGWIHLSDLPVSLDDVEVAKHLDSGLTTTFLIRVEVLDAAGGQGGARVEIRFDLWDEIYHATTLTADGAVRSTSLESREALEAWWRELDLRVHPGSDRDAEIELDVELSVLPFSQAEGLETKRWFSESVRRAEEGRRGETGRSVEGGEGLGQMFDVLIATSIKGRAITTYRWTVAVEEVPR